MVHSSHLSLETRHYSLALLFDFPEEQWPSMDLVGQMLLASLEREVEGCIRPEHVCPPFRRALSRLPVVWAKGAARNLDRLLNRLRHYPHYVRSSVAGGFDLYHVVDHSYSQLVHELPAERTGVFCHDLDTFKCLLEPRQDPRPRWFRAMARHILKGMQKAAVVFYSTTPVREQMERHGLIDPAKLVQARYGTSHEFTPVAQEREPAEELLRAGGIRRPYLLHVGSSIPRKRIDVLLDVFAAVRSQRPELNLVQVGGTWTDDQRRQIDRLGIGRAVTQVSGLSREVLGSLYRMSELVLQPSEAEGFGLPVAEALACGAVVIASDIPVLREVGGEAAIYRAVGDIEEWGQTVERALRESNSVPSRQVRLARAATFSWDTHARTVAGAYLRLVGSA